LSCSEFDESESAMAGRKKDPKYFGLMAMYADAEDLILAARQTRDAGFKHIDAYTPFPVHGLPDAIGFRKTKLPVIVLCGGITGAICGFAMQYIANVWHYPINIGGKPLNSWPAFIVPTFECTILFSAFSALLGMLALNGLPMPYHPLFNVPAFELASRSHFFLTIESSDPKYQAEETRRFLEGLSPKPELVQLVPTGRVMPPPVPLAPGMRVGQRIFAPDVPGAPPISQAGGVHTPGTEVR
jgi:hypothetical protein